MAYRGDRFHLELSDKDEDTDLASVQGNAFGLNVKDIVERKTDSNGAIPSPPTLKASSTGFPSHKDRTQKSKFAQKAIKQQRSHGSDSYAETGPARGKGLSGPLATAVNDPSNLVANEKRSIDEENHAKITQMSSQEIEEAQRELASSLSPSLIERFLKRSNIEDGRQDFGLKDLASPEQGVTPSESSSRKVAFAETHTTSDGNATIPPKILDLHSSLEYDPEGPPLEPPADLRPVTSTRIPSLPPGVHFPQRQTPPPDLDISSLAFRSSLKEIYFPNLPADPTTQSWMDPPTASESAAYAATDQSLPASSIRFDFRGHILPPRLSAQIPISKGLHHHGHAPESAGYTIPELAHLARSAIAAQRCAAYQTLGRISYRLGRGDFGTEGDTLCEGLWECMEKGRVLEGMIEAAANDTGSRSVWATATEAVWLWRKGGGRRWKGR